MSLFEEVEKIIKEKQLAKVIEIGSGHGDGSTQFLARGLTAVSDPDKKLYCIEAKRPQYDNLVHNTASYNFVVCLNNSSITGKSCLVSDFDRDVWESPFNKIAATNNFPRELVKTWFDEEIVIIRETTEGVLDTIMPDTFFEMVVIDGSEFTGYSEFNLIKDRCKYLVLDDVHKCFKNYQVYDEVLRDPKWTIIHDDPNDRNGTAIAVRV